MQETFLYQTETEKSLPQFVHDLNQVVSKHGFFIHNEDKMELANTFGKHGIKVGEGFDLHMIQICNPEKAFKSLTANPERAALMPKFITTFSQAGKVQIRMLVYGTDLISSLLTDQDFPESLENSYKQIMAMIEQAR